MLQKLIKNIYFDKIDKEITSTEYVNVDDSVYPQDMWKLYSKSNQEYVASVHNDNKRLKNIDEQIIELFQERCDIVTKDYMLLQTMTRSLRIYGNHNPYEIIKQFRESKFESKDIRDFVQQVRILCFDDTKEEYQKFNCVNISESWRHELVIWFSNDNITFGICIPFNCDTEKMYEHGINSGHLYLEISTSAISSTCGCSTIELSKLREYIWDVVRLDNTKDVSMYVQNTHDDRLYYCDLIRTLNEIVSYNDSQLSYIRRDYI